MSVAIIDTGCANIASVGFALDRLDSKYCVVRSPDQVGDAQHIILPGVGAAGPAMARLVSAGWDAFLQRSTRPVLGICLGMQLMFDHTEEGDVAGLGLIPGRITRLKRSKDGVWPHMGWNNLQDLAEDEPVLAGISPGCSAYFVHGYGAATGRVTRASTRFAGTLSAMVRHKNYIGCQFHPEKSGAVGSKILQNFIRKPEFGGASS
jgi:glutamine amidotransferase